MAKENENLESTEETVEEVTEPISIEETVAMEENVEE